MPNPLLVDTGGMTFRNWLTTMSFAEQYEWGILVLLWGGNMKRNQNKEYYIQSIVSIEAKSIHSPDDCTRQKVQINNIAQRKLQKLL